MNILIENKLEFDVGALGETIKAIRIRRKLTQAEFAQSLSQMSGVDISRAKVSRWEDGKNEPAASEVVAIARFADCSVDELLGLGVGAPTNGGFDPESLIERIAQATAQRVAKELRQQQSQQKEIVYETPIKRENNAGYQQLHLEIQMSGWGNEKVLRRVQALIQASLQKRGLRGQPGRAAEEAGINPTSFNKPGLRAFESGSIERMKGTTMTLGLEEAIAAICNEVLGGWNSDHTPKRLGESTYKGRPEQLLRDLLNHEHHPA